MPKDTIDVLEPIKELERLVCTHLYQITPLGSKIDRPYLNMLNKAHVYLRLFEREIEVGIVYSKRVFCLLCVVKASTR